MNLQLHHVVSDITGVTGMKIIRAIVGGAARSRTCWRRCAIVRCKASTETIRAALVGNYQPEHVFALTQALALYDFYQARVENATLRSNAPGRADRRQAEPGEPMPKARHRTMQPNAVNFDVRVAAVSTHRRRPDADPRHRPLPGAANGGRVRDRPEPLAHRQALHVVADAWRQAARSAAARCCRRTRARRPIESAPLCGWLR